MTALVRRPPEHGRRGVGEGDSEQTGQDGVPPLRLLPRAVPLTRPNYAGCSVLSLGEHLQQQQILKAIS